MKVILLLFLIALTVFSQVESPCRSMDVKDELTDIDGRGRIGAKRDRKIFSNLLFFYGQLRQTAEGSIEMLRSVTDFALRSFDVLVRVENIASTAVRIRDNVQKFPEVVSGARNPFQLMDGLATWAYKDVVGSTDMMWIQTAGMFRDLAEMNDSRQNIAVSAVNMGAVWDIEREFIVDENGDTTVLFKQTGERITLKQYQERRQHSESAESSRTHIDNLMNTPDGDRGTFSQRMRYQSRMAMQAVNMTDPRLIARWEFNPRAKRRGLTAEVSSSAIANANVRKQQNATNFWSLFYAMKNASDGIGDQTSITASTRAEVLGAENALFSGFGEHEALNDYIRVMSAMVLSRAGNLTTQIYEGAQTVHSANRLALMARARYADFINR
jgi:hypothetical protein